MSKANGHFQEFSPISGITPVAPGVHSQIEVDTAVLPDGRILDLVHSADSQEGLAFLVWHDGEFTISNRVECQNRAYVPIKLAKGLAPAIRFPTALGPLVTARELLVELESCALAFLDLPREDAFLIAAFSLCTFFSDRLPVAPYLDICGPPGSGKSTLLRFLRCVTRRALHAGGLSPASLYRLTDAVCPTLLIDEADFGHDKRSRDIMQLLRNGSGRGADVYVNGQRFRTFGPKVICSRMPLEEAALASRSLHVTMTPCARPFPVLDAEAEQAIANAMQSKLERFRLVHHHEVRIPEKLDSGSLTSRVLDLARLLAAPMLGDSELVERLLSCLRSRDEDARLERYSQPEWVVAAALLKFSHRPEPRVFIGNLAAEIDRILHELGESYTLTGKAVGTIARKSLGAQTIKVGQGYYLPLNTTRRRRIHQLARNMGLTKADILDAMTVEAGYGGPPCKLCAEFGLNNLRDGTELRCVQLPQPKRRGSLWER